MQKFSLTLTLAFLLLNNPLSAETVAGHTAGQFQVNESGAATYSIPISVPPGIAGMEPKLNLVYSSQGRNALLGVGASLSGLPVISRCPATLAQDNFIDGVDLDNNDRFCLDGERLMGVAGEYGADATEYRTEQNSFRRVVSHSQAGTGPAFFTAQTKAGLTFHFGTTDDSRIEAEGTPSALFWAVSRISDTKDNFLTITYTEDTEEGEYRPHRIDYTGHVSSEPFASVVFTYEERPDSISRYVGGSVVKTTQRLKTIESFDGTQLYRRYELDYQMSTATGRSQLASLTECGSDNSCFAPTTFDWKEEPSGEFEDVPSSNMSDGFGGVYEKITGDFNGDSLSDLGLIHFSSQYGWISYISLSQGDGSFGSHVRTHLSAGFGGVYEKIIGDFNADGRTDLGLVHFSPTYGWIGYISLSLGNGTFDAPVATNMMNGFGGEYRKIVGDFNGDNRTDLGLVHFSDQYGWIACTALSDGDGAFGTGTCGNISNGFGGDYDKITGDFNSDGLTDLGLVHFSSQYGWIACAASSQGDGSFSTLGCQNIATGFGGTYQKTAGDFNSDGITDLALISHSPGNDWVVKVALSKGDGTYGDMKSTTIAENFQGDQQSTLGDFNGDGALDVAMVHFSVQYGWISHTALSNRDGTFLPFTHTLVSGGFGGAYEKITGDFNGDALVDLALVHFSEQYGWIGKSALNLIPETTEASPPLLQAITTGHGRTTRIFYAPLTDASVYTPDSEAEYPERDFQGPIYAVKSFSASDGIGGENSVSYRYGGAKLNLQGRGFRGFDRTTITDEQTDISTTIFYERDYRCISSKILRTEQRQPDGTLISEVDNEIAIQDHGSGVHFSYIQTSTAKSYELDGSLVSTTITTSDYDEYGNATSLTVDYGDGYTETTSNTFEDDLDSWFLGRLTRSEVTRTAPGHPEQTRTTAFEYDEDSGLLVREIIEPDLADLRLEKHFVHDGFGNVTTSTTSGPDISDRTHSTTYGTQHRYILQSSNALGHTETRLHDRGNLVSLTGPNQLTTSWNYDGFGRQVQEIRANGTETQTAYELCDETCPDLAVYLVRVETSGAPTTTTYFDLLDREIRSRVQGFDGTPVSVDTDYNELGQVSRVSEPYFAGTSPIWTVTSYDLIGRPTTQTEPGNRVTTTAYSGRTTTTTNPLNQQASRTVDPRGQLVSSTDHLSSTITYDYDAFGNMVEMNGPLGNVTRLFYDARGRKISIEDPDTGTTTFTYNSIGELVSQTDANQNTITISYDLLGRTTHRNEPEGMAQWVYDVQTHGIGKIATVSRGDYLEEHFYDEFGRPSETRTTIAGEAFSTTTFYDLLGRPEILIYPTGFGVRTTYNDVGYAKEIRRLTGNMLLWQADTINARGQLEAATLGNGLTTERFYNPETGRVESIQTGSAQELSFSWDALGNLTERRDEVRGLSEIFNYDDLNRLVAHQVDGQIPITVSYDAGGNIEFKSDVGSYTYGENDAGPHAVTSISGLQDYSFTYDANGNQILKDPLIPEGLIFADGFESGNTEAWGNPPEVASPTSIAYTSFNKPYSIATGNTTLAFDYSPGYHRYRQEVTTTSGSTTKLYIGGVFERESSPSLTREIHFVRAGGETIAVFTVEDNGAQESETTRYLHRDHLGSVQTITDETGAVVEVLSFDAWGKRRNALDWSPATGEIPTSFDRGFTGHEHLDEVDLIHMNGRVYDPTIGRFLSADPFVQVPDYSQSLNRYSYVLNNPLSLTDPSGFFFKSLFRKIRHAIRSTVSFLEDNGYTIVQAIGIAFGQPELANAIISAHSGIQSGAGFGDILRSTIVSAAVSTATKEATNLIGDADLRLLDRTIAHGVVQGVARSAQGGKFEHGFLAGAVGELGISGGSILGGDVGAAFGGIIAGGTAEELGGGKFANGALSAAHVYAFNYLAHAGRAISITLWDSLLAPAVGSALGIEVNQLLIEAPGKKYLTYLVYSTDGTEVYAGRTSGYGDPEDILYKRLKWRHSFFGHDLPAFVIDRVSLNRDAIRGREQQLIDYFGGALADPNRRPDAMASNIIRGVAKYNRRGLNYHNAATTEFHEELHEFTGHRY